ncbi:hypothetical protein HK100_000461 [Physocladia obscura]|uniref:Uncharacterized protein n=1 Tax=Physocladia obscura TaxID=109957 RepID=A0AAD5SYG8_9FUNG|nr:hypothetical protein HK100_000461 [Physocladia obscura]
MALTKLSTSAQHTSKLQQSAITTWLEVQENFRLITGSAGFAVNVVTRSKLRKTDAYNVLMLHVNETTDAGWDENKVKSQYQLYLKTYKETKKASEKTGEVGVDLYALFGERQNITAAFVNELPDLHETLHATTSTITPPITFPYFITHALATVTAHNLGDDDESDHHDKIEDMDSEFDNSQNDSPKSCQCFPKY